MRFAEHLRRASGVDEGSFKAFNRAPIEQMQRRLPVAFGV